MKRRRLRKTSAGTLGRSRVGGHVEFEESRESWLEKYPEVAARADLLQAIGVPLALTMRSMLREVHGEASIAGTN